MKLSRKILRFRRSFWEELAGFAPELTVREREYRENFRHRKKRALLSYRKDSSSLHRGHAPIIVIEGKSADTTQVIVDSENQLISEAMPRLSHNSGADDASSPRPSAHYTVGSPSLLPRTAAMPRPSLQPTPETFKLLGWESGVRMGLSTSPLEGGITNRFFIDDELMFQVASDLHMEMWARQKFYPAQNLWQHVIERTAPVLVLLGDISVCGDTEGFTEYKRFVTHHAKQFSMVLLVAGNHEYHCDPDAPMSVKRIKENIRQFALSLRNVYFLDDEMIEIDGVLIFGTTLWSEIDPFASAMIEQSVNDFEMIYVENEDVIYANNSTSTNGSCANLRKLEVADVLRWHNTAVMKLKDAARQAKAERKKLVVLSHHAPTFQDSSSPQEENSPLASAFCTNLELLMDYGGTSETSSIHTWAFGHTHHCTDQQIQGVHVISNQFGHTTPLTAYNESCCFRID